jgi:CrcB protein
MITTLGQVAIGGAAGASLRYLVGAGLLRAFGPTQFPLSIITVNVLGSLVMGAIVVAFGRYSLMHLSPLMATGFLGGFTTFSSFSMETVMLIERGAMGAAAAYVLLSVGLSIGALFLGMAMARGMLA